MINAPMKLNKMANNKDSLYCEKKNVPIIGPTIKAIPTLIPSLPKAVTRIISDSESIDI